MKKNIYQLISPKGMKLKSMGLLMSGLLWSGLSQAQESVNASGGNASGTGGTVSYSVGQVVYTTNNANSGSAAQGVQHAYEIFSVGMNETDLNISLVLFPNPTDEFAMLQINDYQNEKLSYKLYDIQGKQLMKGQIAAHQTQINMNELPPATYFMNIVSQDNKKVQSFKIIKNSNQ